MAEITIFCPHCNQELSIDEQYLSMEVECPTCNKNFTVEIAPAETPALSPAKNSPGNLINKGKELTLNAVENTSLVKDPLSKLMDKGTELVQTFAENTTPVKNVVQNDSILIKNNQDEPDPGYADEQIMKMTLDQFKQTVSRTSCGIAFFVLLVGILAGSIARHLPFWNGLLMGLFWGVLLGGIYFVVKFCFWIGSSHKKHKKRDLVREYFSMHNTAEVGIDLGSKILSFVEDNIPLVNIIPIIIKGITESKMKKFCRFREPIYDDVQQVDMEFLENLDVLSRFGKNMNQLVSPMQTLFSPAFDGVDNLRDFSFVVSQEDSIYRYNLEEVTKIYTFEDQLFVYTGVWSYAIGKMISEKTEAFFFKDITDIKTESSFKIHTKYEPKGCLSIIIPWLGKPIETVYKESESFILTSASGNAVGLNIGFEDAILVTGASYTQRNDNEKIIHAIRKMIEEKKVSINE